MPPVRHPVILLVRHPGMFLAGAQEKYEYQFAIGELIYRVSLGPAVKPQDDGGVWG